MDWQSFADGMRRWFSQRSGITLDDVMWAGEPEGMHGYPCAYLDLLAHNMGTGTDEVRLVRQGAGQDAIVRLTGNRTFTLSCKVRTRDQTPLGRAFTVLERVRNALQLPSSQACFGRLGVGFVDSLALTELGRTFDKRQESEAVLDLKFTSALDSLSDVEQSGDGGLAETIGTIESVIAGGDSSIQLIP